MSLTNGTVTQNIDISHSETDKLFSVRSAGGKWSEKYGLAYFVVSENPIEPASAGSFLLCAVSNSGQRVFATAISTSLADWSDHTVPNPIIWADEANGRIWVIYYDSGYSSGITVKTFDPLVGTLLETKQIALSYGTGPFWFSECVQGTVHQDRIHFLHGSTGVLGCAVLNATALTLQNDWVLDNSSPWIYTLNAPVIDSTGKLYVSWNKSDGTEAYVAKYYYTGNLDTKQTLTLSGSYTYIWVSQPTIWGAWVLVNEKINSNWDISSKVLVFTLASFATTPTAIEFHNSNTWADAFFNGTTCDPYRTSSEWWSGGEYIPPPIVLNDGTVFLLGAHTWRYATIDDTTENYLSEILNGDTGPVFLHGCGLVADAGVEGGYRPIQQGDVIWSYKYWQTPRGQVRVQFTIDSDPLYIKGKYEDHTAVLYCVVTRTDATLTDVQDPNGDTYAETAGFHFTTVTGGVRSSTAEVAAYWHAKYYRYREWNQSGYIRRNILNADLTLKWTDIDALDTGVDVGGGRLWGVNHVLCVPVALQQSVDGKNIVLSVFNDMAPYCDSGQPLTDTWTDGGGSHSLTYNDVFVGSAYVFDESGDYLTSMIIPAGTFSNTVTGAISHTNTTYYPSRMAAPHDPDDDLETYYMQTYLESMIPHAFPVLSECGEFYITARLGYCYRFGNPNCCGTAVGSSVLFHQGTGIVTHSAECHVGDTVLFDPRTGTIQRSCPSVSVGEFVRWDAKKGAVRKSN